jgi:uncharacterized protein (DUF169 family)
MNNNVTNILMEFLQFCGKNKIGLSFQTSGSKNYVNLRDDEVLINICDDTDKNLKNMLEEKFKELSLKVQ